MTSEETARFTAAKERIIGKNRERNGIGTLSEKTVHAVLKNYYAPDETQHEIPVEGCVADIFNGKEIIEIQTRSFDRMRPKLERFLPLYPVTIVYPIPYCKHVFWIDEETGEISGGRNIQGATAAGLKVGIYFFSQAVNEVEAVEEASMTLSLIKKYRITYPVYIDVESANGRADGISKAARTSVINAFCQTIRNSGYTPGLYANKNWLTEKINTGALGGCKIWLAQYVAAPTYGGRYEMWQYSSRGSIAGIKGNVDLNVSYMGY